MGARTCGTTGSPVPPYRPVPRHRRHRRLGVRPARLESAVVPGTALGDPGRRRAGHHRHRRDPRHGTCWPPASPAWGSPRSSPDPPPTPSTPRRPPTRAPSRRPDRPSRAADSDREAIQTGRRIRRPGGFRVSPGASPAAESAHLVGSPAAARRLRVRRWTAPRLRHRFPRRWRVLHLPRRCGPGLRRGRRGRRPAQRLDPGQAARRPARVRRVPVHLDRRHHGANSAAGYQLATDDPVMAIGGFNGTDPSPTLAQFQAYVAEGKIHYYISGGGFGPPAATRRPRTRQPSPPG